MLELTGGAARARVTGRESNLDQEELDDLQKTGTIILDELHTRPLYFDGRFLTARDLTREQNYFLSRQASLGRAGGAGVVQGLMVLRGNTASSIEITAGHGVTPGGEMIVLPGTLRIELANITESQRLDAAFGISRLPRAAARSHSGLFIIALRAVEFTANPIASYPTTINGPRSTQDGDIVEGVVVTLIPYPTESLRDAPGLRRARVARELFVDRAVRGLAAEVLPLAMVALDRNGALWIDPFMVRREVGAEHGDILNFGFAPRALREAHFLQYDRHLADVLKERDSANRGRKFPATEHFFALPAAGRMPSAAINPEDFTQTYFPAEVDVDLSIIPDDEIAALVEESLLLPPLDLMLSGEEQESTSVLVLVPVARKGLRLLRHNLPALSRQLLPAAPGLVAKRKPFEVLQNLKLPRQLQPVANPVSLIDAAWRKVLASTDTLWYVRRRNLHYKEDVPVASVRGQVNEFLDEIKANESIKDFGLHRTYALLKGSASSSATAEMIKLFSNEQFLNSRLLLEAGMREMEAAKAPAGDAPELAGKMVLERAGALKVAARFADSKLGEGLIRVEKVRPGFDDLTRAYKTLTRSNAVPEFDKLMRLAKTDDDVATLTDEVLELAKGGDPLKVNELINVRLKEIRQ
jgi:hypothetical protein